MSEPHSPLHQSPGSQSTQPQKTYAESLTKQQVEEFRIAFDMFDQDKSGDIGAEELQTCFKFFGQSPTLQEVKEIIAEIDDENDPEGDINFEEFLELMA